MEDNLESYFKKHLKDNDPEKADWNDLSDDVWTKATSRLDKPKKNRKIIFLWTLVGVLFISTCISSFYLFKLTDQVEQLDHKSYSNLIPLNQTKSTSSIIGQAPINKNKKSNNISSVDNLNDNNKNRTIESNNITTKLNNFEQKNTSKTPSENNSIEPNALDSKDVIKEISQATFIATTEKTTHITTPLSSLSLTPLNNQKLVILDSETENTDLLSTTKNKSKNPKFMLSLYAGTALTSTPMHTSEIDENINGYNKFQFSSVFGFKLKHRLKNNLYLSSGLENIVIKSWSYSTQNKSYNPDNEYNSSGQKYNDLKVLMPTPTGGISTTLVFRQNANNPIKMDEKYKVDMEVHQEYSYISVPLGLTYYKAFSNVHAFEMELGMSWFRLLENKDEFSASLTRVNDNSSMDLMQSKMGTHANINKNLFNIYFDLGYNYFLNNSLSVLVGGNYFRSITSIYSNNNTYTSAHGTSIKAGIIVKF